LPAEDDNIYTLHEYFHNSCAMRNITLSYMQDSWTGDVARTGRNSQGWFGPQQGRTG